VRGGFPEARGGKGVNTSEEKAKGEILSGEREKKEGFVEACGGRRERPVGNQGRGERGKLTK